MLLPARKAARRRALRLQVTLEVKGLPQLTKLAEKLAAEAVPHKVWLEQPENVATALATAPQRNSVLAPHFKRLQLCRW